MPPYFSIDYSFDKSRLNRNFVITLYNYIFKNGFPFRSGYTEYDKIPINRIIEWNQALLEKDFHVGSQHYSHGYKQILFETDQYSELRGIWFNLNKDEIQFTIIVPEHDVMTADDDFIPEKIAPLRQLSVTL